MKAITLRGIDETTYQAVKKLSSKAQISMNKFILNLIKSTVGTIQKKKNKELDKFFGMWSEKDYQIFMKQTKSLRKVDKELWD